MASNREERFLMRQRGAGARQLRNSGFDLAIPGLSNSPLKPPGSGRVRRTPQSGSQPPSSSRRAPKVTPIETQRSSKRTPATGNTKSSSSRYAAKGKGAGTNDVSSDNRGSSTRKRKLATMLEDGGPTTEKVESELLQTSQAKDSPLPNVPSPGEVLTMAADSNDGLEHLILSTQRTSKKRKKRRSIGQNSTKRVRTSLPSADATASSISHPNSLSANHQQQNGPPASGSEPDVSTQQSVAQHQGDSAVKAKRKKRKSIGKIPKVKRKSLIVASTSTQNVQATSTELASSLVQGRDVSSPVRRNPQKALASVEEVSENEFDEELSSARRPGNQEHSVEDDILSSAQTNRQGRPRTSHVSATAPVTKKAPKPQSARPKAPKRRTHPRTLSPISDTAERRPRKERPGAIPITVHRLSRPLPTDYSSADEDILAATNPFPTRGGVNAIDVLSQICREMVAKAAETLKLGEIRERGERKRVEIRKRKAVEMFGEELDARLFQMTEALDNNYALTIRLRQANKEKVAKREELLETKRLREEVAIEMDEVRAKHQRDTKVAQDEFELNTMISDIELAVQRGRALQEAEGTDGGDVDGLGVRLRTVAEEVTSAGPGGGLLERVKSFNRMVERAIAVL